MDAPPGTWRTRRSAVASTPGKRTLRVAALGYLPCMRFWGFLARLVVTVLVLLTVVGGALFGLSRTPWWSSINPFSTRENDRTGPSVLRSLNDISEFHPAYAHYETVVDLEDDTDNLPSWVSGGRVIYVGKGNVDAVVDFGRLNQSSVVVSPDGESVAVDLPLPRVDEPVLDLKTSYVADRSAGFITRFQNSDLERRAQLKAVQQMRRAAEGEGMLVDRAKENTTAMLRGLLSAAGFSRVTVTYGDEPAG